MSPVQLVRIALPGTMLLAGVVLLFVPDEFANGAGVVLIGSAVLVALANGLLRFSVAEMEDRDREQAARDFYGEHGRWPDDPEPPTEAPPGERAAEEPHIPPPGHPGADARPVEGRPARGRRRRPPRRPGDERRP
jgi:hypothetical protein